MSCRALGLVLAGLLAGPAPSERATELRFVRAGVEVARVPLESLRRECGARVVAIDDPYYGRAKRFHACPLAAALARGFGLTPEALAREHFFLRARDGYVKPAEGSRLAEEGGFLAFADADLTPADAVPFAPVWEPIDRRQVDPAPFYVVWVRPEQRDTHRYPWPYQLVEIELAPFESAFPHTAPTGLARDAPAWRGFEIFRRECVACHAINGEGGTVGPELNVPRSIVEYRPAAQLREFIRRPQSFRYTSMPSHEHLSDADLDALLAYFEAMKSRKRDPLAKNRR